jgi:hypothetical protein
VLLASVARVLARFSRPLRSRSQETLFALPPLLGKHLTLADLASKIWHVTFSPGVHVRDRCSSQEHVVVFEGRRSAREEARPSDLEVLMVA